MKSLRWINKQDDEQDAAEDYLNDLDRERLTNYKWRYSLETREFTPAEVDRLFFLQYRFPGLVADDRAEVCRA